MYKVIVKPAMLYRAQIWTADKKIPQRIEAPLNRVQSQCLKKVMGAYKSTPTTTLEMESGTPPIQHHLLGMRCQYALKTSDYPVQSAIDAAAAKIILQRDPSTPARPARTP